MRRLNPAEIEFVAALPLEQCRWQLLNRDYRELEVRGTRVEQPVFEKLDNDTYAFAFRRMLPRRDLEEKAVTCGIELRGFLRAIDLQQTQVSAEIHTSALYCVRLLLWLGLILLVLELPDETRPCTLVFLVLPVRELIRMASDRFVLTKHLKSSLSPKRFVPMEERFGST